MGISYPLVIDLGAQYALGCGNLRLLQQVVDSQMPCCLQRQDAVGAATVPHSVGFLATCWICEGICRVILSNLHSTVSSVQTQNMQCHGPAFVENNMGKSSETYKVSATNTKLHTPVHMPVFGYIFFIFFPAHRKLKLGSLHDASIS